MELRGIIAKNICSLRTGAGLTQLQLAEILNYSDKAVSKWERGESVPDIFMLKRIADYFGVSVDYLLEASHPKREEPMSEPTPPLSKRSKAIISFLAASLASSYRRVRNIHDCQARCAHLAFIYLCDTAQRNSPSCVQFHMGQEEA